MKWWRKLKSWWRYRKYDRLTRLRLTRDEAEVMDYLEYVRDTAHTRLDQAFSDFLDKETLKKLAETHNKQEIRKILQDLAKLCRTLVVYPMKGNLEDRPPKKL